MSDLTWSDIAYQEEHGFLPDSGSSAAEMREYYGDPSNGDYDPDEVAETERHIAESRMAERIRRLEEDNAELERENTELRAQLCVLWLTEDC